MTLLTPWLSTTPQLHLDTWRMDALTTPLTLQVTSPQALVHCPICRFPTRRVHSRDVRTGADLPWASWRVVRHLQVRKFFCAKGRCPRRMFTERLWPLVAPWAWRTQRLVHWLAHIALALGGRAGVRPGAPDAIPVADRCHLLQHLADALDQVFHAHSHTLEAVNAVLRQPPVPRPDGTVAVPVPPPAPPRLAQELAHPRRARRLALHPQIWGFHQQGWPAWAMAQPLGIGKHTGFRSRRMATVPERQRRADRGRSLLTPDHAYLLQRWNTGHRDAWRLFRELQRRGSAGSSPTVARDAPRLRQAQGQARHHRPPRQILPVVAEPSSRQLTARRATWLVLRRPERQDKDEAAQLTQLQAQHPEVAAAIALARDFARLVRERQPEQLDPWLARAAKSPLVPLPRVAKGLRDDDDAVRAGITLPWSTGPVEGQINRLKMLKRQMCGRATRDRLQQRVLRAA